MDVAKYELWKRPNKKEQITHAQKTQTTAILEDIRRKSGYLIVTSNFFECAAGNESPYQQNLIYDKVSRTFLEHFPETVKMLIFLEPS